MVSTEKNEFLTVNIRFYPEPFSVKNFYSTKVLVKRGSYIEDVFLEVRRLNPSVPEKCYAVSFGKIIPPEKFRSKMVYHGQAILFLPVVEAMFAPLIGGVVGALAAGQIASAVGLGITATIVAVSVGFSIGSMLGSVLFPIETTVPFGEKESPTYSWELTENSFSPDTPVPIVYGEHKVAGQVINMYVENLPSNTPATGIAYLNYFKVSDEKIYVNPRYANTHSLNPFNPLALPSQYTSLTFPMKFYPLVWYEVGGETVYYYSFRKNLIKSKPGWKLKYSSDPKDIVGKRFMVDWFLTEFEVKNWVVPSNTYSWVQGEPSSGEIFYPPFFSSSGLEEILSLQNKTWNLNVILLQESGYDRHIIAISPVITNVDNFPLPEYFPLTGSSKDFYFSESDITGRRPGENLPVSDNFLNIQIALSEGEIENITDVRINDQPIEYFSSEVSYIEKRFGTIDQEPMVGFSDIHSLNSTAAIQINSPGEYIVNTSLEVDRFVLYFKLPMLYDATGGDFRSNTVVLNVSYRILGSKDDFSTAETITITRMSTSPFTVTYSSPSLDRDYYQIKIERVTESFESDPKKAGNVYLSYIDEVTDWSLAYPGTALIGIRLLASDRLSGNVPTVTSVVRGVKILQPKIVDSAGNPLGYDQYYWDEDSQCYRDTTGEEAFWDGITWHYQWSANPVWILYDILTNQRYGLGAYTSSQGQLLVQDKDELVSLANYCDTLIPCQEDGHYEKRFRLDIVIDSAQSAVDLIHRICTTFRCLDFFSNGKYSFIIDKPEMPVQVFNSGNIIANSFQETFGSFKETPNVIEVEFWDASRNFTRSMAAVYDSDEADNPVRKKSYSLIGVTRESQALRIAKYYLLSAKYNRRLIQWKSGLDSFVCQPGDTVLFQHDVPQWTEGGRIIACGNDNKTFFLDANIIQTGNLQITVRTKNGTVLTENIVSVDGSKVVVANAFSETIYPQDLWVISSIPDNRFFARIISIARIGNQAGFSAVEYHDEVYEETTGIVISGTNVSLLSLDLPLVTNISASYFWSYPSRGVAIPGVIISWTNPQFCPSFTGARVYIRLGEEQMVGESSTGSLIFHVYNFADYIDEESFDLSFCVASVSRSGGEYRSPWQELTINLPPKAKITGLVAMLSTPDTVTLTWDENVERYVSCYEVRAGVNWNTSALLTTTTKPGFEVKGLSSGNYTFLVKPLDIFGRYADSPASVSVTITKINNDMKEIVCVQDTEFLNEYDDVLEVRPIEYNGVIQEALTFKTIIRWDEDFDTIYQRGLSYGLSVGISGWDMSTTYSTWDMPVLQETAYYTLTDEIAYTSPIKTQVFYQIFSSVIGQATATVQYRKKDTPSSSWSEWQEAFIGELTFTSIQFRLKLSVPDDSSNIYVLGVTLRLFVPWVVLSFPNQPILSGGTFIPFPTNIFSDETTVVATGLSGELCYIDSITLSGVLLRLRKVTTSGEIDVDGFANILVRG